MYVYIYIHAHADNPVYLCQDDKGGKLALDTMSFAKFMFLASTCKIKDTRKVTISKLHRIFEVSQRSISTHVHTAHAYTHIVCTAKRMIARRPDYRVGANACKRTSTCICTRYTCMYTQEQVRSPTIYARPAFTRTPECLCTNVRAYIHVRTRAYVCVYIRTYTHRRWRTKTRKPWMSCGKSRTECSSPWAVTAPTATTTAAPVPIQARTRHGPTPAGIGEGCAEHKLRSRPTRAVRPKLRKLLLTTIQMRCWSGTSFWKLWSESPSWNSDTKTRTLSRCSSHICACYICRSMHIYAFIYTCTCTQVYIYMLICIDIDTFIYVHIYIQSWRARSTHPRARVQIHWKGRNNDGLQRLPSQTNGKACMNVMMKLEHLHLICLYLSVYFTHAKPKHLYFHCHVRILHACTHARARIHRHMHAYTYT